ncbi:ribonuclease H-like domain-containing protein [Globomyces pollinis-pini]|nr:ribonuclease H-like domain-containing protein [Globomyces pollinis-pini]
MNFDILDIFTTIKRYIQHQFNMWFFPVKIVKYQTSAISRSAYALSQLPHLKKKGIMVVDTETTGFSKYAHVVQIAWNIYSADGDLKSKQCHIIKPYNFKIPKKTADIHGITNEIANQHGKPIRMVLNILKRDLELTDTLVAHNMSFDDRILLNEFQRYGQHDLIELWNSMDKQCTMKLAKQKLKLTKNPKLIDLYQLVVDGSDVHGLHNADVDVKLCGEIYFRLKTQEL